MQRPMLVTCSGLVRHAAAHAGRTCNGPCWSETQRPMLVRHAAAHVRHAAAHAGGTCNGPRWSDMQRRNGARWSDMQRRTLVKHAAVHAGQTCSGPGCTCGVLLRSFQQARLGLPPYPGPTPEDGRIQRALPRQAGMMLTQEEQQGSGAWPQVATTPELPHCHDRQVLWLLCLPCCPCQDVVHVDALQHSKLVPLRGPAGQLLCKS